MLQEDRNSPVYQARSHIAKTILQNMKVVFISMHVAKAISIIGTEELSQDNMKAIQENSIKRIEKIYDEILDNDETSEATAVITRIATSLCEDFINIKTKAPNNAAN